MWRETVGAGKERWTTGNGAGRRGLTVYATTGLSGKRRSDRGTSPGSVEATMGTLATGENTRMGREALHRVETL